MNGFALPLFLVCILGKGDPDKEAFQQRRVFILEVDEEIRKKLLGHFQ